jgi:DNA end-binding protein Ku
MSARAIWKGKLTTRSVSVPVRLYSAVVDRNVHFHILEKDTETRVKQHMVNPETNEEVPKEEIRKGYQIEPGIFVLVTEKELEKLQPDASRDIEITRFVSPSQISSQWYDRPYFLGPDGDEGAYFAFADALAEKEEAGIARWVMRGKEYIGALEALEGYLVLATLRHAEEVITAEDLPEPTGRALDKKEIEMAKQLVGLLEGEFDPAEFQDEYRERVLHYIEQKQKGKAPRLKSARAKRSTASLGSALSKSIAALKKGKKKDKEKVAA